MVSLPDEIIDRILIEKTHSELHPHFQHALQGLRVIRSREEQKIIHQRERQDTNGLYGEFGDTPEEVYDTVKHLCVCDCCPRHQTTRPQIRKGVRTINGNVSTFLYKIGNEPFNTKTNFEYAIEKLCKILYDKKMPNTISLDEYERTINSNRLEVKDALQKMFQTCFDRDMSNRLSDIYMFQLPSLDFDRDYQPQIQRVNTIGENAIEFFNQAMTDFKYKIANFTYFREEPIDTKLNKHANFCTCQCRQYLRKLETVYL